MHLVEVIWREVPDVFSEGGECRKMYSVIFFSRGKCTCVGVCVSMESSGSWLVR